MNDFSTFIGRFHPLLVHFPIALLALAAVARLIERRTHRDAGDEDGRWSRPLLAMGALSAVLAAAAGWLLGAGGGYGGAAFAWHLRFGLGLAVLSVLAAASARWGARWPRAEPRLVTACAIALLPVAHLGATLTHGDGYLTQYAPASIRQLAIGLLGAPAATPLAGRPLQEVRVYADLVAPVLLDHCVPCHGSRIAHGGLRLDTIDGALAGGDGGPALVPGRAATSDVVRRVYLPASHADAMPPRGYLPMRPADAALLRWWVDEGARADQTLADVDIPPDARAAVEAAVGPVTRGGPSLPDDVVADASAEAVAAVTAHGLSVVRIADGLPFLSVHSTNTAAESVGDEALESLAGLAPQLLWLDLSQTGVTDRGLAIVSRLPSLTRLYLQQTRVTDAGLRHLDGLARLEYLNLYGTAVTDDGLGALAPLVRLRALYLWRTRVTAAGTARLQSALPRLVIDVGGATSETVATPVATTR